jgi:hypothetical protein
MSHEPEFPDSELDAAFEKMLSTPVPPRQRMEPIKRMGRGDHFVTGAMSARDPRSLHPNLNEYRDGGMGGDENHSVVGYVPTHVLAGMHGNATDHEGIERHKQALLSGEGFTDPVMVQFDHRNKRIKVGEGNHRVDAAMELGVSHVPTRVVRSTIDDGDMEYARRQGGTPVDIDPGPSPFANQHEDYWPSDIHPSHLFRNVL